MNISLPVTSSLESVEFTILTPGEIRAVSVRRIENPQTFDSLLNPTPGGLYDPALGAWGDALCGTCSLHQALCPGHPGHIDLPVPLYQPFFMDQVLKLLRAQCIYCHRFRMRRTDISRYACKLRLLQYGLFHEAAMIEAIGEDYLLALPDVPQNNQEDSEEEVSSIEKDIRQREAFVRRAIREKGRTTYGEIRMGKTEGGLDERREIIKDFFKECAKGRTCRSCQGISPTYRKDGFVKVFEKALSAKEAAKMATGGFTVRDAVTLTQDTTSRQSTAADPKEKGSRVRKDAYVDEAIADVDMSQAGVSEGEGIDLDEDGDITSPAAKEGGQDSAKSHPVDRPQRFLNAMEVRERLNLLFEKEQDMLSLLYNSRPRTRQQPALSADLFFAQTILVPPSRFRPEARMGDQDVAEAQQNNLYKMILNNSARVAQVYREIAATSNGASSSSSTRRRDITDLHEAWAQLQESFNSLLDKDKNPIRGLAGKRNEDGIKQKLEKKEGLFRMNMMGKRVNYAARSVISPDPNIETSEIGVPPVFARKLTYPEPVTSHNFRDMQQAVINGAQRWPGASAIENENGQIVNLRNKTSEERVSLANQLLAPTNNNFSGMRNKKVHRHLTNGDVVLMNRQPTLHKPSIMGHRVRVLPGEKTIRMHYANCNTYNADFDGDEMNMHFPQNEIARAEALQIADTDHQYISGTAGNPLRGLIQDHLSVSVSLCNKDTFLDARQYEQLVYSAIRPESGHILAERIELVPPAIMKPTPRWSGKQVITTILKNIKPTGCSDLWMTGKSKIGADRWATNSEEGTVLFYDGVFICGILDKNHLGPTAGGFVHAVHETYGSAIAGKLLSGIGRLLTRYLGMIAFSCGMDDLRLTPEGEARRRAELSAAPTIGLDVAAKYVALENESTESADPELLNRLEDVLRDDAQQQGLELLMNASCMELSSKITAACLPTGLEKQFPKNQMQSMTTSGAKGGPVNANLISCNLGQQVLEGRRVPLMISGKSVPAFVPFDSDVRSGGYVVNRFLSGIGLQEYFFHHMAGREGLIDTAVKTSRSGYLQRCLVKGLEGLQVAYDSSVRDSDGKLVQFLYGEDGLEVSRQKYLTDFTFALRNVESELAALRLTQDSAQVIFEHRDELLRHMKAAIRHAQDAHPSDPIFTQTNPARYAWATSEKFYSAVASYLKANKDRLIIDKSEKSAWPEPFVSKKVAEKILTSKYLRSLVHPGEAVGIIAGQSVGEPSTQMTLNTFHLAGHSAKNVTLGIPRLREILMTASNHISTPSMTLVLNEEISLEGGEKFAKEIGVLPLTHVLDRATVKEHVTKGVAVKDAKVFEIRLDFFPSEMYTALYGVSVSAVLDTVQTKLLKELGRMIEREIKKRMAMASESVVDIAAKVGTVETATATREGNPIRDHDDDDDDTDDEGDATAVKRKANRTEAVSYGPNDDDDDAVIAAIDRAAALDEQYDSLEDEGFGGSPPPDSDGDDKSDIGSDDELEARRDEREKGAMEAYHNVSRFRCDELSGGWCEFALEFGLETPKILMLSLLKLALEKSLIREISGIGSTTFVANAKVKDHPTGDEMKRSVIHTAGVNLKAMQNYGDYINPNNIITNDIAAVLEVYGVEACRQTIINELSDVFKGHGISVDNRHLNLIGDYMTRNGGFSPFNRIGLTSNVSPFTKMSFETTVGFLKDAVLEGDWDDLRTPSGRIVAGRLNCVGTGAFDVFTRVL